ncbi:MAG: succinate dehydrogenase [Thalassobaculaceae bacterium]|nr:succinate dehydrogenase [Thalassobaculaceae bacterium]
MEPAVFALQRLTALILAPLVIVHLAVILLAVEGGLSAAEILERTRGSVGWAAFYGLFVVAAALHAPIGLRAVIREHTAWGGRSLDIAMALVAVMLLGLGFRAVIAVVCNP